MHLLAVERRAEFVGRHRDRRERGLALALEEAEALGELAGMRLRRLTSLTSISSRISGAASSRRRALRHVGDDHRDLGFEVDAPGGVGGADRIARADELIRAAPRYISGSVQNVAGTSAPRDLRTSAT